MQRNYVTELDGKGQQNQGRHRIKANPLKNAARADGRGKQMRMRRALTDDELRKLVANSEDRGIIYFTAARTGLRQEELKQATWGDMHLDGNVPFVVVRDCVAKNKKEESVRLVPEIVEALTAHRPADWKATDLVFPKGIPRALRLRKDPERNGIPYRDELGRSADFHALRCTWATFLQRNGIAQRFAMKLMRHSDIKLISKVYIDEMQLTIYEAVKNLPRLDAVPGHTQIRAQNSGANGQIGSQPDAIKGGSIVHKTLVNSGVCHSLAEPVATCQLERVKGIEPSSQAWEARILPLNHTRVLRPILTAAAAMTSPNSPNRPLANGATARPALANLRTSVVSVAFRRASPTHPRGGVARANVAARSFAAWLAGRAARANPAIWRRRERRG